MVDLPAMAGEIGLGPMYFVYILQSLKTLQFYKGLTHDLDNRLHEHFAGKSKTTKKMLSLKLIHVEVCDTREDARLMEVFFKTGVGRAIIKEIANQADVAKW